MKLNIKLIEEEFKIFLNSVAKIGNHKNTKSLFSLAFPIHYSDIIPLLNTDFVKKKKYFYWKISNDKKEFLGIDSLINICGHGENRIEDTGSVINNLQRDFISNWKDYNLKNVPTVMGGIKFAPNQNSKLWSDYSDSDWFVPRFILLKDNENTFVIYNFKISRQDYNADFKAFSDFLKFLTNPNNFINNKNGSDILKEQILSNSISEWGIAVNKALDKISEGVLNKVVLSREVILELNDQPQIPNLLTKLSIRYPKCYTFAYHQNESVFIGASPEKLAKFSDNWIEIDALAGSAPRGNTEEEDLEFERFLLNSKKNLNEQQAVVLFIKELLEEITDKIYFDENPVIRKLPNIQHLWTIIKAKLNDNYKLFDVLKMIHPTPAICGTPWKVAQDYILETETHDRGLYTGNIGWFNFEGSGEFAVAIRSALIKSNKLYAYAGCGIVEDSDAEMEFEESEIKLKPILSLFVDEKVYQP